MTIVFSQSCIYMTTVFSQSCIHRSFLYDSKRYGRLQRILNDDLAKYFQLDDEQRQQHFDSDLRPDRGWFVSTGGSEDRGGRHADGVQGV